MSIVSDVEIRLRADIARLQQDMDSARRTVGGAMDGIRTSVNAAGTAIAALAIGMAAGAFAGWIKGAIDATDAVSDISQRTGLAIKDIAGLQLAFQKGGMEATDMEGAMVKLSRAIADGDDSFARIGVSTKDSNGALRSSKDVLYEVADAFADLEDGTAKTALAVDVFGKSGAAMIPLLNEGSQGLRDMADMADKLGITFNETTVNAAGDFNDTLDFMALAGQGVARQLAAQLLPTLNSLAGAFLKIITEGDGVRKMADTIGAGFKIMYTVGSIVAQTFSAVGSTIGMLGAQMVALLQGDFKTAMNIGFAWQDDMKKSFTDTATSISNVWTNTGGEVVSALAKTSKASGTIADKVKKDSKTQTDSFGPLIAAIQKKIEETDREARGLEKMTESQSLVFSLDQQLASGKLKLTSAQEGQYRSLIDTLAANEDLIKSNAKAKELADQTQKAVDELNNSRQKSLDDARQEAINNEQLAATYGMTKSAIEQAEVARLQERLSQSAKLELDEKEIAYLTQLIELKSRSATAGAQVEGMNDAKKAGEELDKFLDSAKAQEFGDTLAKAFGRAGSAMGQLTTTFQSYANKQLSFSKAREALEKKHSGAQRNEKEYTEDLAKLEKARFSSQLGGYGDMAGAAAGFFDEQSKGYKILSGVSQAFHAAELAATIAELVPKGISAILSQGQGDPYTAFARIAAMTALVAGLGVAVGGGGGGGAPPSAASRQKANGTGSILGDSDAKSESLAKALEMVEDNTYRNLSVNYDMLSALRNIESSLSGLGNLIVRGTGINDLASSVKGTESGGFWGGMMKSIFGGKVSVLDAGIKIDPTSIAAAMAGGINASSYVDTKKSGGWFSKDKYRTQFQSLGSEVNDQFSKVIVSMADGVKAAGAVLGLSGDAFTDRLNSFVVDLGSISLKDLKGDEVQAALEAAFSKMGDDLAKFAVDGLAQFQKVGEGAFETLVRISNNYATVDAVMLSLGKSFGSVGLASVAAREHLIDLAGGLDDFTSQASFFLENFYSDAEKEASLRTAVYQQLGKVAGGSAVQSIEQFKSLALSQDLTTSTGREAYSSLMSVAQAFIDLKKYSDAAADAAAALAQEQADAIEAQAGVLRDGAADAFSILQRSIDVRKKEIQASFTDLMSRFAASIEAEKKRVSKLSGLASVLNGTTSGGVPGGSRASAQAQIASALAIARAGGYLPDANSIKDALSIVSQDSADQFSSFIEYQRDALLTQNSIEELSGITNTQLSAAEKSLMVMERQRDIAQAAYDAEVNRLDGLLSSAQIQIDAINGVNLSVMGVSAAFSSFQGAITAALKNKNIASAPSAAEAQVESLYQSVFGRTSDAGGLAYWAGKMREGTSLDSIRDSFYTSAEYQSRQPPVYNAQQRATMVNGDANAAAFDARMKSLEAAMVATANATTKFAAQFDQVSNGGNMLLTENS